MNDEQQSAEGVGSHLTGRTRGAIGKSTESAAIFFSLAVCGWVADGIQAAIWFGMCGILIGVALLADRQ